MKNILFVMMGMLIVVSMLLSPAVKSCPCSCPLLQACYKDCKALMPDTPTTMACDGGCLIGCIWHGNS